MLLFIKNIGSLCTDFIYVGGKYICSTFWPEPEIWLGDVVIVVWEVNPEVKVEDELTLVVELLKLNVGVEDIWFTDVFKGRDNGRIWFDVYKG